MCNIMATLFISSAKCDKKSVLGSTISIDLKTPIDTYNKKIRVLSSNLWYVFPNVGAAFGNTTIRFSYNSNIYTFTLLKGLYSIDDINETVIEKLENSGLPNNLFKLIPDEATNRITMKITTSLLFEMDFTDLVNNKLFATTLGFEDFIDTSVDTNFDSSNIALLNVNNNVYIHCSFASGSYFNQNAGSNIIGSVALRSRPGSMIYTENSHPVISNCMGGNISSFTIWLTNENEDLLDMNGEEFQLVLEIF